MTNMELKLDPESFTAIATAAIYDQLNDEARESIIKQAIQYLMTPEKNRGYGTSKTPLQQAFDQAIYGATMKVVKEKIENDPQVEAKILELLGPLLTSAIEGEAEKHDYTLADKLGQALGQWLGDVGRRER